MKKILLAFEGSSFSNGCFQFAHALKAIQPIMLTGLFLPHAYVANLWRVSQAADKSIFIPSLSDQVVAITSNRIFSRSGFIETDQSSLCLGGNKIWNADPFPTSLSAHIFPKCASIIIFERYNPSPIPCTREALFCTR